MFLCFSAIFCCNLMNLGFLHYKSLSQIFCHRIKQIDYALYDENDENQFEGSRCIKCHIYDGIIHIHIYNKLTSKVSCSRPILYKHILRPPIPDLLISFTVRTKSLYEKLWIENKFFFTFPLYKIAVETFSLYVVIIRKLYYCR